MREKRYCIAMLMSLLVAPTAFGHVTISPGESPSGLEQTYVMRVPTERDSPTVRIEAEFPAEVTVTDLLAKALADRIVDGRRRQHRRRGLERWLDHAWSGRGVRVCCAEPV
jgi:hypothetical protein